MVVFLKFRHQQSHAAKIDEGDIQFLSKPGRVLWILSALSSIFLSNGTHKGSTCSKTSSCVLFSSWHFSNLRIARQLSWLLNGIDIVAAVQYLLEMISLVSLNVQSRYLVSIDRDALLVDLAVWRFGWSQTDVTSYRLGHYWLLVVDRSFTCALGLVRAEVSCCALQAFVADRYLLFVVVGSKWRLEVPLVAHHPTATVSILPNVRSRLPLKDSRVHGCN